MFDACASKADKVLSRSNRLLGRTPRVLDGRGNSSAETPTPFGGPQCVSLIDLGLDIEQEPSGQIKIAKTGIFATNKP
jgi:hypothetical protein